MELLSKTLKSIKPQDAEAVKKAWDRIDNLTKPIGSLGVLEEIAAKVSGITGKLHNKLDKRNIIIMCADNGVVEEGISSNPQKTTALVTENFTKGITGVNVFSRFANSDITVVDIGINADIENSKVLNRKISYGTSNIAEGPAMSREQLIKAIETGIEIVDVLVEKGYELFGTGEMGVGNTTTSAAVISILCDLDSDIVVGRGAGLLNKEFKNKKRVVRQAIELNKPNKEDVLDILSKVGGYDIAGLCGCFLGAAKNRVPIVIDGVISSAAALCAYKMNPFARDYIFPSHMSAEPGAVCMMKEIGLEPMLNLRMRLGEGSGCPIAFKIIDAALCMINEMGTFEDAKLDSEDYVDIR